MAKKESEYSEDYHVAVRVLRDVNAFLAGLAVCGLIALWLFKL